MTTPKSRSRLWSPVEIEFTVAGETITLGPGQTAVIPSGVPHGARVVGDRAGRDIQRPEPAPGAAPGTGNRNRETDQ